jgi:hypothetical protein
MMNENVRERFECALDCECHDAIARRRVSSQSLVVVVVVVAAAVVRRKRLTRVVDWHWVESTWSVHNMASIASQTQQKVLKTMLHMQTHQSIFTFKT